MVDSLNLSDFLLCFRRFKGRRGMSGMVVSDNAKTFKAGSRFVIKLMASEDALKYFEDSNVEWRFNLSRAPWWCFSRGW